ncbi:MAG TPA: MFS transporter [Dermatophilaceae bacterium]|jgi:MFS family permease|nr:MFS transporter [Dermatophilaceae bacterium]
MRRPRLLILASSLAMLGWGSVLPYQYAYAANTRGWGNLVAAAASSLFSVGALFAAPLGGRLADRMSPVTVAVWANSVSAVAVASLVVADTPTAFLAGMLVFGAGVTAAAPAQAVLVLHWVGSSDRRRVFAWQFTGQSLGMAVGALAAGYVVDLDRPNGMWPAFATAAVGFLVSAVLILVAGRGTALHAVAPTGPRAGSAPDSGAPAVGSAVLATQPGGLSAARAIWRIPALRWTAVITATMALAFYAQFESGLPAYALTVLHVRETTIGLAAAVNCAVIIVLQMVVVRVTAKRGAPGLLMVVGAIWTLAWVMLTAASSFPELAAAVFVSAFGVFAVGETMYAPVLNPLTASLAPEGMVGTTLGLFAALQTGVSAIGPLVAGILLGAGQSRLFLGVHLAISAVAFASAWRLRSLTRTRVEPAPQVVGEETACAA